MREKHWKLVRDNIPEIICHAGNKCETRILSEEEYIEALRKKILEEAKEAATASQEDLVKELADLYEVIDSILKVLKIKRSQIMAEQERKRNIQGGFEKRIQLLWTEEN